MNKRIMKVTTLFSIVGLLSGCLSELDKEVVEETIAPDQVAVQTTANQLSMDYYRAVITDGRYEMGVASSSNTNLSSAGNTIAYEEGLLRISKGIFPTDQYFLQEGQIIDEDTMTNWLARESSDNPEGLNPALAANEEETAPDTERTMAEGEETTMAAEENQVIVDSNST